MFFVVKIKHTTTQLILPIQWISNLKIGRLLNYGINKKKTFLMFYSEDGKKEPNFSLKIFSAEMDSDFCFYGNIIKGFGKCHFIFTSFFLHT